MKTPPSRTPPERPGRRALLAAALALPWLAACTTPLPLTRRPVDDPAARALLQRSAQAHGLVRYRDLRDLSVAYDGQWRPLVDRIQPALVDAAYRGRSEERLLPHRGIVAQAYRGTAGTKQVSWRRADGSVSVWRNGTPSDDHDALQSAALVADAYGLFLLGPLWILDRVSAAQRAGSARVDDRDCDLVDVWLEPGLGRSALDRATLAIDRADAIARRFRFTLEGTPNTQGAVAEVETFDHVARDGLVVPTRFYERVVHPLRIPAHDWHMTGFDVDRGFTPRDLAATTFGGAAARPAESIA